MCCRDAPGKSKYFQPLCIASWNMSSMPTELTDGISNTDVHKTALIDSELSRLNTDIAALQETRLPEYGSLCEISCTFFWQGKHAEDAHEHGVRFTLRNTRLNMTDPPHGISEKLMSLKLVTCSGTVYLLCIYAPILQSSPDDKDNLLDSAGVSVLSNEGL